MNVRVFDRFPVLTTPRLVLRDLSPGDGEAVLALRRDEEVNRYQSLDAPASVQASRALIARWRKRFSLRAEIRWAVTTRDDGVSSARARTPTSSPGSIAATSPTSWRAACGAAGWRRRRCAPWSPSDTARPGWIGFEAVVVPEHEASVNVLRKAGFAEEGLLRAYGSWRGQHHDLRMFSVVLPAALRKAPPAG